jgi:predicted HTH domain antitoxin
MSIQLEIPDSVVQALRLPPSEQKQQLLLELALSLYARGLLSIGKARELAGLTAYNFAQELGKRAIPRHYGAEELDADLDYAGGQ